MFRFFRKKRLPRLLSEEGPPPVPTRPVAETASPEPAPPGPIDDGFTGRAVDIGMRNRILTIGRNAGLSPEMSERYATGYVHAMERFRIDVSRPNQIEGLRRMILMGCGFANGKLSFAEQQLGRTTVYGPKSGVTMIGITEDGLLFRRGIGMDGRILSNREALRIAREEPERITGNLAVAHPQINKYSEFQKKFVRDAVSQVVCSTRGYAERGDPCGPPKKFIGALNFIATDHIRRNLAFAVYAMNKALDPDLLRLMRGCAMSGVSHAEWLSGAVMTPPEGAGDGRLFGVPIDRLVDRDLSRYREQAVRAYPALARVIFERDKLRHAVDEQVPLAPEIADMINVPETAVRSLNGLTWQMAGVRPSAPYQSVRRIALIPPEFKPTGRSEYRVARMISQFRFLFDENQADTFRRFARGGSPYRFRDHLERTSAEDVEDAANYVVDKLLLPLHKHAERAVMEGSGVFWAPPAQSGLRSDLRKGLLDALSIKGVFDLSDRWHRNEQRHNDHLISLESGSEWPSFIGDLEINGVTCRELNSTEQLKRQGRMESHCVGGYTSKVIRARREDTTLIFSLEKGDKVLGTAEIRITPSREREGDWEVSVTQNRSRENSGVSEEAKRVTGRLCRTLKARYGDLSPDYLSGLRKLRSREGAYLEMGEHLRNAGYDIWEKGCLEAAWGELSEYLPRAMRKAGLEGVISQMKDGITPPAPGDRGGSLLGPGDERPWDQDRNDICWFHECKDTGVVDHTPDPYEVEMLPF